MIKRTKYDGKLTDALIQTVVEAELRQAGLVVPTDETEEPTEDKSCDA